MQGDGPRPARLQRLEAAADRGDVDAMVELGLLLAGGQQPADIVASGYWWQRAAEAGSTSAMYQFARHLQDHGPENRRTAVRRWLESAADLGHPLAMVELAVLLEEMDEYDTAGTWWERSARAGSDEAMFRTGYRAASSSPPDLHGARHWWQRAARAGHLPAMINLGVLLNRSPAPVDRAEACRWWRRAAFIGSPLAATLLASS